MNASTILKGTLAGATALAIAGAVFAQTATGTPSSGTSLGVTPPPSSGATNDTSRLATDCSRNAADMRSNTPPHLPMGCDKAATTTIGAAPATTSNSTAMGATGTPSTTTSGAAAASTDTTAAAPAPAQPMRKVAKADRN